MCVCIETELISVKFTNVQQHSANEYIGLALTITLGLPYFLCNYYEKLLITLNYYKLRISLSSRKVHGIECRSSYESVVLEMEEWAGNYEKNSKTLTVGIEHPC